MARGAEAKLIATAALEDDELVVWSCEPRDEDVDLNLESFRELSDPAVLEENQARFRREARNYAEAIKSLRKSKGLKQGEIPGLSERQVRRLESGDVYPHSSTLEKLAVAHDVTPAEYVRQLATLAPQRGSPNRSS